MLEESPRMLQNEMEKSLGVTLVATVELFKLFLIMLKEWSVVVGTVKMTVAAVN